MYDKTVERIKAIRVRLEPKAEALEKNRRFAGCRRYVYNRLLAERGLAWKALGDAPDAGVKKAFNREWSYVGMTHKITAWRREIEWLGACPVHALQNGAKDLQGAYERWWAGLAGAPAFKRKSAGLDSWRESDPALLDINGQAVKLPKIGWVKARISRKIVGSLRSVTVKQEGEDWYATIVLKEEVEGPKPGVGPALGLDLGVARAVTESTGTVHDFGRLSEQEKGRLRRFARSVSRKVKGSKNREKAKLRLGRLKRKISRRTLHAIHVMTFRLAKNHGLIGIEDLNVKGMTASAKRTKESPGRNVAQKRGLNREILARGWGEVRRQLKYKCEWYGSRLVPVDPRHSSQECSACGHVSAGNRTSQAIFLCVACGHAENADVNAAKIVLKRALAAGHAVTACGEDVRRRLGHAASVKQEPTRGAQRCAV